ncbi:MAG: AAA family ATPase [Geminicoccaceae bacterium]
MIGFFSRRKEKKARLASYVKPKWAQLNINHKNDGPAPDIVMDFPTLEKKGFLTPDILSGDLARDYNLVKRRLFQRLSYFGKGGVVQDRAQRVREQKPCPVVLLSSGSPGEGKTFSSCNLALSLALDERLKVLLIDADLAKPSTPGVFDYDENKPGLFEQLIEPDKPVDRFILKSAPLPINILPAGQATSSPAQLLASQVMVDLIDDLATQYRNYDIILMDGPPLLATTEAAALAPLADEVVIVVGTGETTVEEIGSSLDFLGGMDHVSMLMNRIYFQEARPSSYPYGDAA